jgi:TRAP-type mannitol/chloroaromatic compound transport system substrate-binding protein
MKKTIVFLGLILFILAFFLGYALNTSQSSNTTTNTTSKQTFHWKLVTTWPPNFPIFQTGIEKFAKDIALMSDGRLKIQVFAGGELVPALQAFDAVSQGAVQMEHGASYYWAGKVPAVQFMSAVPFGMTAKAMNAWLYYGDGLKLWREMYEPFNLISFPAGNSGVQMGGWFKKKIESVADLKGLKMRIPGLGGKVLAKAGGTPILLSGGELYTALERGTIDATEWAGPYHDKRLGLYRAAKYYYYPGWHEPGTTLELIINGTAWKSLPEDLQKIVEIAATALNQKMFAEFEALNIKALRELQDKYHVKVLEFPAEVINKLKQLTAETLDEEAAKNADFKKVYEAYKQFQKDNSAWNAISDEAYNKALNVSR